MCLEIYIVKYFKQWIINFTELQYMYCTWVLLIIDMSLQYLLNWEIHYGWVLFNVKIILCKSLEKGQ